MPNWRPEKWSNPHGSIEFHGNYQIDADLVAKANQAKAFEAGADAMFKALSDWGKETGIGLDMSPMLRRECSHCWHDLEKK